MKRQVRVILLDDEPIVCERLKPALEKIGFYVEAYTKSQDVIDRFSRGEIRRSGDRPQDAESPMVSR